MCLKHFTFYCSYIVSVCPNHKAIAIFEVLDNLLDEDNMESFEILEDVGAGQRVLNNTERYALYVAQVLQYQGMNNVINKAGENIGQYSLCFTCNYSLAPWLPAIDNLTGVFKVFCATDMFPIIIIYPSSNEPFDDWVVTLLLFIMPVLRAQSVPVADLEEDYVFPEPGEVGDLALANGSSASILLPDELLSSREMGQSRNV